MEMVNIGCLARSKKSIGLFIIEWNIITVYGNSPLFTNLQCCLFDYIKDVSAINIQFQDTEVSVVIF